jgi:hypothetical protein
VRKRTHARHDGRRPPQCRRRRQQSSDLARGAKADVCWTFDGARFKAMLKRALAD